MFMSYYLLVVRGADGCDESWSISQRIDVTRGASNGSGFNDEEYVLCVCARACACVCVVCVHIYVVVCACVCVY